LAELAKVVDGDTLHLRDGRKVRVVGVNSPELARKGHLEQPYARAAQVAAEQFFAESSMVGLQLAVESRDRYGRVLAHVFNHDGDSLSALLLSQGLAQQAVIPPNIAYWRCLAEVQQAAMAGNLGLWGHAYFAPKDASSLRPKDSGYRRVRGRIERVTASRDSWWLEIGRLSLRLRRQDLSYFADLNPQDLLNKELVVSGWLIDRSRQKSVQKNAYPPLLLQLRHPAMIDILDKDGLQ
jgi:endonuclease YncB( thermonuclease family)